MPITSGEIVFRYSVVTASAGDTQAGTAAGSLGDQVSTTAMATGLNGLFDDISGAENAASTVDYRCFFVLNNDAESLTLTNPTFYITSEVAGGASIAIATDNIAVSAKGSGSAQAATIASETTAPSGVSAFSSPTTAGTGLSVGNLNNGQVKGLWARRTAANTAALSADGVTFNVTGDTL